MMPRISFIILFLAGMSFCLKCQVQTTTVTVVVTSSVSPVKDAPNKKDSKGRKQGYWKKYEGEILKYEGTFSDDRPVGTFKYYFDNGILKAINRFTNSGRTCYAQLFYPSGKKMAEGKYFDQKKDSVWRYYSEEEKLTLSETYKLNKKNGPSIAYFSNGNPAEEKTYKADSLEGTWRKWYENGQLKEVSAYLHHKLHGQYTQYFEDGKLSVTGFYSKDFKEGEWVFFTRGGEIKNKVKFKRGSEVNEKIITQDELDKSRKKYEEFDQHLQHNEIPPGNPPR